MTSIRPNPHRAVLPTSAAVLLLLLLTPHVLCDDNPDHGLIDVGDVGGTAEVLCDNTCKGAGGKYDVTGQQDNPGALLSSSYFLYGAFSASLKLQAGVTGTLATSVLLSDDRREGKKDHFSIEMQLVGHPETNNTLLLTRVVAEKKHNTATFQLPFDGSKDYHQYTVQWSSKLIMFVVDGIPSRELWRAVDGPWPKHPLLPQVLVADDTTTAQGTLATPAQVTTSVLKFALQGCLTEKDHSEDEGCPGNTSTKLVWNQPMNAVQMKMYTTWHYKQMRDATQGWVKN